MEKSSFLKRALQTVIVGVKPVIRNYAIKFYKTANEVYIADTTLRDGEQSPGAVMTLEQKLEIARKLADIGVYSIDAGFPACSQGDFESVSTIAREIKGPIISALSRARKSDINATYKALKHNWKNSTTIFIGTSKLHREDKLGKTEKEILDITKESIRYASGLFSGVTFAPEDAIRTEIKFLYNVIGTAIDAGASCIGVPDTIGCLTPTEAYQFFINLREKVPELNNVLLGCHFHNDLGLATANTLAAVQAGVDVVQCTVNGLGERAGNASLEEVVMALKLKQDLFGRGVNIKTEHLTELSKLVEEYSSFIVQPNKAIIGENVFATAAGIHQDGILKNPETYTLFPPEIVGAENIKLVLTKHSGKSALIHRLGELGIGLNDEQFNVFYQAYKSLADTKKIIDNEDLLNILDSVKNNL